LLSLNAQQKWSWVELDTLPIALSNNAVASAKVGDTTLEHKTVGQSEYAFVPKQTTTVLIQLIGNQKQVS
jgi:hypothetical protein